MDAEEWNFNELNSLLLPIVPIQPVALSRVTKKTKNGLKHQLKEEAVKLYESKEAEFPEPEAIRDEQKHAMERGQYLSNRNCRSSGIL